MKLVWSSKRRNYNKSDWWLQCSFKWWPRVKLKYFRVTIWLFWIWVWIGSFYSSLSQKVFKFFVTFEMFHLNLTVLNVKNYFSAKYKIWNCEGWLGKSSNKSKNKSEDDMQSGFQSFPHSLIALGWNLWSSGSDSLQLSPFSAVWSLDYQDLPLTFIACHVFGVF